MSAFGERVKTYRVARGMSQEELATQTGMLNTTISKIEHGQRKVTLDEAVRLAEVLRVTLAQLAGVEENEIPAPLHVAASHCLRESQQLAQALSTNLQNLEALVAH